MRARVFPDFTVTSCSRCFSGTAYSSSPSPSGQGWSQKDPKIMDLKIGLRVPRNQDGARNSPKSWLREARLARWTLIGDSPRGGGGGGWVKILKIRTVFGVPLGYVNWLDPISIVILSLQIDQKWWLEITILIASS